MKRFRVKIQGSSPYLMHKFSGKDEKVGGTPGVQDWKEEVSRALYKNGEGKLFVPSSQIHGCLIEAGKQMRVVGKGKSTYSKLFGAFCLVEPMEVIISPQKFDTDERSVVIQKSRVIRYRPKWEKWSLEFDVVSHEEGISGEAIKQGLEQGGKYSGIGDYRPQKKGPFGRFEVIHFEEVK